MRAGRRGLLSSSARTRGRDAENTICEQIAGGLGAGAAGLDWGGVTNSRDVRSLLDWRRLAGAGLRAYPARSTRSKWPPRGASDRPDRSTPGTRLKTKHSAA